MKRQRDASASLVCFRIDGRRISTLERLFTWVASLWLRYLAWQARRALIMVLKHLDDRTLKDIGLERDEIEVGVGIAFERWATERLAGAGTKAVASERGALGSPVRARSAGL